MLVAMVAPEFANFSPVPGTNMGDYMEKDPARAENPIPF